MKYYRSSISKKAREHVVATFIAGPQRFKAECTLNGKVVGIRYFHESGELAYECPLKNGVTHGTVYRFDAPGKLTSAEPYLQGIPHGVARQWSNAGRLIGTYTIKNGTGVDLWWNEISKSGPAYLSEARHLKSGKRHGFEWWLNENQRSVWQECHFWEDQAHGIEREWNIHGRLKRGHPRYWVRNNRVTKRQYLRESSKDPTLPRFRAIDNQPQRKFPPYVLQRGKIAPP
jgi:hypothetical protein